jgi:hypothetical protein
MIPKRQRAAAVQDLAEFAAGLELAAKTHKNHKSQDPLRLLHLFAAKFAKDFALAGVFLYEHNNY